MRRGQTGAQTYCIRIELLSSSSSPHRRHPTGSSTCRFRSISQCLPPLPPDHLLLLPPSGGPRDSGVLARKMAFRAAYSRRSKEACAASGDVWCFTAREGTARACLRAQTAQKAKMQTIHQVDKFTVYFFKVGVGIRTLCVLFIGIKYALC